MSYGFYKVLHLVGILGIFISFGGLILHYGMGGTKKFSARKWIMITHGVGMALAFVAGFGLMARIGLMGGGWPLWIYLKVGIWLILGLGVAIVPRKPQWAPGLWVILIALGGCATYLANFKPQ